MVSSNFANTHGLSNPQNYSCAEDIARLCSYAMKNKKIRKIVQTRIYQYNYTKPPGIIISDKENNNPIAENINEKARGSWENTNKMLG